MSPVSRKTSGRSTVYISISIGGVWSLDSLQFLMSGLQSLADDLLDDKKKHTRMHAPPEQQRFLNQEGIYPYLTCGNALMKQL